MSPEGYEFVRPLGGGAFGDVHLARRIEDGRQVAVKVLRLPTDANLRRFYREVSVLHGQLTNPHVVDLLAWSFDQDPAHLVMEYCGGGTLRPWVTARRPWPQVAEAVEQAAAGLAGIHERGGFHRDIKPDNLLLAHPDGGPQVVKVGDFGLARDPDISSSGPVTCSPWGTKGYMAPELMFGAAFNSRCDVYSLGVTGIELLTGSRDPASLKGRGDVPATLRRLLQEMTSVDPAKRPTVRHVQSELRAARREPTPAALPRIEQPSSNGGTAAVVGLGLLAALFAAATANTRDASGRFHGPDGRFRGGRWG